ncbi:hypothetical protein vseg_010077 [Gypsophila vaccaria]
MVGTSGKGAGSTSKGLALVPDDPEPLKIIIGEATDGALLTTVDTKLAAASYSVEEKNKLNSEVVSAFGDSNKEEQMADGMEVAEGFEIDYLIAEGDMAVIPDLDGGKLEGGVSIDAVTNMDVENSNEGKNEGGPENDKSNVRDAYHGDTTKEKEQKADEDAHTEDEEKACVANANEHSAASKHVLVAENRDNNKAVNTCLAASEHMLVENANGRLAASELVLVANANEHLAAAEHVPVSIRTKNVDESIKENASPSNEVKDVAEKVSRPKKKVMRKKLIKKRISLGKSVTAINEAKQQASEKNEGSVVLCETGTSNESKPLSAEDNQATVEVGKLNNTENVQDQEKAEGKPLVRKLNILKKKKPLGVSGVQTGNVEQGPKPTDDEPPNTENQIIEQEIKNEVALKPKARRNRLRKRKTKKVVEEGTQDVTLDMNAKDVDKPGSSKNGKSKKVDSMGMIFMCSSETKKDCYRYKVFGLPAGKKDIVSKIYKGMRLFLFDVDLKMLYGIYKAAGPGSSNIEPRAFKSKFPSQVRFSVLEDCLPIAEEKFKKIIKENYYTKNKFDCQLNNEQVKNLCQLFRETTKKSESIRAGQRQKAVASTRVDRKRKRTEDNRRVAPVAISSRERERRGRGPEQVRHVHVVRTQEDTRRAPVLRGQDDIGHALLVRGREETRLAPMVIDERYRRPVVVYEREAYLPQLAPSSLHQPLRAEDPSVTRIYSYERDPGVATYRRDPAIDYRDLAISAPRESRHYAERSVHGVYATYREPHVYREPAYDVARRHEHYDYLSTEGRYAEYYRSDDARPPLPLHRRY